MRSLVPLRHVRAAIVTALLLAGPLAAQPAGNPPPPRANEVSTEPRLAPARTRAALVRTLDSLARAALADGPIAGMTVAVVRGRDTLLHRGYGVANVEHQVPAAPTTVYRIGSITKQFTAAAVMRLVDQGRVGLEDPITKYVPNAPVHGRDVRIRHLLNHTSGLRSYTSLGPRWIPLWRADLSPDSILGLTRTDSVEFAPGTKWSYNNTGYVLLGMLLEKVGGRPYATFLRDSLLAPLGLRETRYCDTDPVIRHRASGYQPLSGAPERFRNAPYLSMTQPYAAGALCSTAGELVAWQHLLASGRVVSPAAYARMTTPDTLVGGGRQAYGFGLGVDSMERHLRIAHNGGIPGFVSELHAYPADSLVVVVLTNTAPSNPARLARNIGRAVMGTGSYERAPAAPRETVPLAASEHARYVGAYELQLPNGTRLPVRIFSEGGNLLSEPRGQSTFRLLHQGGHAFLGSVPGIRMVFAVDGAQATKFTLYQGGGVVEAPRVP